MNSIDRSILKTQNSSRVGRLDEFAVAPERTLIS